MQFGECVCGRIRLPHITAHWGVSKVEPLKNSVRGRHRNEPQAPSQPSIHPSIDDRSIPFSCPRERGRRSEREARGYCGRTTDRPTARPRPRPVGQHGARARAPLIHTLPTRIKCHLTIPTDPIHSRLSKMTSDRPIQLCCR